MNPWDAEREVSAAIARAWIEEDFPQFAPASVKPFSEGWDNFAFLVNESWVFRFPRRAQADALLQNEARVLRHLPPLPLPVPSPQFVGARTMGHRLLPGRTADRFALDDTQRARLAAPLAGFLRALHAVAPPPGIPGDEIGRLDRARVLRLLRERLQRLGVEQPAWLDEPVRAPRAEVLVHGDLHARQILLDGGALPCGIIDWGDAHFGDRAADLSVAHSLLPRAAHAEFREAYGSVDEPTWRLARLRALHVCAALADWARDRGEEITQREALGGIHRII